MQQNNIVAKESHKEVYWLLPNLIGYLRIFLVVSAFCICFTHPYWFTFLYGSSQLLDSIDGYLARRLNKVTTYGAMLDMVLDRVSTAALLVILTHFYPAYIKFIISLMLLDIISHFLHIYSALLYGRKSHKAIANNNHYLLKLYYGNSKIVLALLCIGSEACLLWFYLQHFGIFITPCLIPQLLQKIIVSALTFLYLAKQVVNIIQLKEAVKDIRLLG
jgi:CDP-diacylglycerol--inositol 3-phosphatidyltransferase